MGRLLPRTIAIREHLAAVLRDSAIPLTTPELRDRCPANLLPWRADPVVYTALRALERLGICRRVPLEEVGRPMVDTKWNYWIYTQDQAMAAVIAALDAEP